MTNSLLAMVDVCSVMFMTPQPTTLVTINPKKRNYAFSGILTRVQHRLVGLTLNMKGCHLVSCLKAYDIESRSIREAYTIYSSEGWLYTILFTVE